MKITKSQKEFILENFFNNFINEQPAGWREIASVLIDNKKCIVAGEDKIWIGGVGNFIHTKKAAGTFGCLEYSFDIDEFIKSEWAKQIINENLKSISNKISDLKYAEFELKELINNC